ncbi:protein FATTY ACID EXPORT 1, chloroplastic [Euphorbia lathyris]|uniref:protein FATTY ACID EXPORT 1, chloroplastic n=1 Tax=Euphorbia lathyris TaxID=212925 RepID=UPI003313D670
MMATTTAPSQLSCFSAINRKFQLHRRPSFCPFPSLPACSKIPVVMTLEARRNADTSGFRMKTTRNYAFDDSKQYMDGSLEPLNTVEERTDPRKAYGTAKIHDFCFGIPYGGLVLCGGLVGFLFSRNPAALSTGVLFGGALLALSFFSLKIWRHGKSSIPFVLGQAVLAAILFWKNFQGYSSTNRLMPTGFFAFISAAMLCFYLYVMISGGNPPPKKLQSSTVRP